jgi:ATP-dependent helicase HepA
LFITHDKKTLLAVEKYLLESVANIKIGLFHSDLSLMARDRQAAYFAEPNGAQILLCTEIGSEGRNFQFVHNLILFDLPLRPGLLEQRIGRLDRIGQKFPIKIHVPYLLETWEESLFKWFNEGMNAFIQFNRCGDMVFEQLSQELQSYLAGELDHSFIDKTREVLGSELKKIDEGRDYLVELNSYHPELAKQITENVKKWDDEQSPERLMDRVFSFFGVDVLDSSSSTYIVKEADNMFIPHFPCLDSNPKTITFSRSTALSREEYDFITWDHEMVKGCIEIVQSEGIGGATIAKRKDGKGKKSFVECYYYAEIVGGDRRVGQTLFAPRLVRVLVDFEGTDFTEKFSSELLNEKLTDLSANEMGIVNKIPKDKFLDLIKKAKELAHEKVAVDIESAKKSSLALCEEKIAQLKFLKEKNNAISDQDLLAANENLEYQQKLFDSITVELDSIRLII